MTRTEITDGLFGFLSRDINAIEQHMMQRIPEPMLKYEKSLCVESRSLVES